MNKLHIDDNCFRIIIYYKKNKLSFKAYSEKEFKKISENKRNGFLKLVVIAKKMTWGLYKDLQDFGGNSDSEEWDNKAYKEEKLRKILVDWDAKVTDSNGKIESVEINDETILNLSPDIAEKIIECYDNINSLTQDEEKKLAGKVHAFVMSHGKSSYNVSRDVIENDLIEEFHWLPQDIDKIPYKKLQKFFLIRRVKQDARMARSALDAQTNKIKKSSSGSGQIKRR